MFSCLGSSKLGLLQKEIDSLRSELESKDCELDRLRRLDASQKQKEEHQTESLQAAAAHIAQLEARLSMERMEQQRINKENENQLRSDYEQQLSDAAQQLDTLERELEDVRQRFAEHQLLAERQRRQLEDTVLEQTQQLEKFREDTRQLLEIRLLDEQQKLERLEEKHNLERTKLLRRLAAEEHRARRFQKQIANFTETMEEVSNILTAVENDQKTIASPVKVDKKGKASVAADQLRQSIAMFKRTKDEQPLDQGALQECT